MRTFSPSSGGPTLRLGVVVAVLVPLAGCMTSVSDPPPEYVSSGSAYLTISKSESIRSGPPEGRLTFEDVCAGRHVTTRGAGIGSSGASGGYIRVMSLSGPVGLDVKIVADDNWHIAVSPGDPLLRQGERPNVSIRMTYGQGEWEGSQDIFTPNFIGGITAIEHTDSHVKLQLEGLKFHYPTSADGSWSYVVSGTIEVTNYKVHEFVEESGRPPKR